MEAGRMKIAIGDRTAEVSVPAGTGEASIDGRTVAASRVARDGAGRIEAVEIAGELVPVRTARSGERVFVWCAGAVWEFREAPKESRARAHAEGAGLTSPMPGRVRKVLVAAGDTVKKGDVLLILEAMKMEHSIRAPRDGRVVRIAFGEGDLVDAGVELVEIGDVTSEAPAEDTSRLL
jgi:acetyl/propionyl-CoA carboxylase alpha subunit